MGRNHEKAVKHLKDITGREMEEEIAIDIDDFTDCALMGEVVSIVYRANKKHLGDKKPVLYEHDFSKGTMLLSNGKQLLIYGPKLKINYRGVIN